MWKYEVCNHRKVFLTLYDEAKALEVAKTLSADRGEHIAVIGLLDTFSEKGNRYVTAFVHGVEETEMIFQITIAETKKEADIKAQFFIKQGIPAVVKRSKLFGWSIATDRNHHHRGIELYEEHCAIVNVFTNEIVRPASWEKFYN